MNAQLHKMPGRIQSIKNREVINRHPFGMDLQGFCKENIDLFPDHGFMDGGCLALALALKLWIHTRNSIVVIGREGYCDHAVLRMKTPEGMTVYLDSDGMATASDLITKMRIIENIESPVFSELPKEPPIPDYMEAGVPYQLVRRLRVRFGDWDPCRISLNWLK